MLNHHYLNMSTHWLQERQHRGRLWLIVLGVVGGFFFGNILTAQAQTPVEAGYRSFSYTQSNSSCNSTPTGEKPESKLWFNDGFWWGSLCSNTAEAYHIYRLDPATQSWIDTWTPLDDRVGAKMDALWDGQHLYVVSHIFTTIGQASNSFSHWGRLYRYSYNHWLQVYSLDPGFPTKVTRGKSETLTVAKDTSGQLWVAYVEDKKVMVNHSRSSDLDWGEPFTLPVSQATNLKDDDIAAVVAFDGRIGVMWSNQNTGTTYFAAHVDGTSDQAWRVVSVYTGVNASDDHFNLKVDEAGNLFAVIKTSFTSPLEPLIVLLTCPAGTGCTSVSDWQDYTIYQVQDDHTRPLLLIDTEHRQLHIFTANSGEGGEIHRKVAAMDNIQFSPGQGEPFIQSSVDLRINNVVSTKQNLNSRTGLVVLASDVDTKYYLHNDINLSGENYPTITSFTPASGLESTEVTLIGKNFNGVTQVAFNGISALPYMGSFQPRYSGVTEAAFNGISTMSFTVDSDTQLRVKVPAGVTNGKIRVTNADGAALSVANFIIIVPPEIRLFLPTRGPIGAEVTLAGTGFKHVTAIAFNGVPVASFTIDSDTQLRATVPPRATTGPISLTNAAGTVSTTDTFIVITRPFTTSLTSAGRLEGTEITLKGNHQ